MADAFNKVGRSNCLLLRIPAVRPAPGIGGALGMGGGWRRFPEIHEGGLPLGRAGQQESAPAQIASSGMDHRHGEGHGLRGEALLAYHQALSLGLEAQGKGEREEQAVAPEGSRRPNP